MISPSSAVGSVLFGLHVGYIGPIIEPVSIKDIAGGERIASSTEGLIVSLFSIGAMVTACPFISSFFLERWAAK